MTASGPTVRSRGRPRRSIDPDAVADAVAELFAEGDYESVSIGGTATKLGVSRATLYRTVSTKQHLLAILCERSTKELTTSALRVLDLGNSPREDLNDFIRLQVEAAVRMRRYAPVFFGSAVLPADVFVRWRSWSRAFEGMWIDVVRSAMAAGELDQDEPVVAARLLLGMCVWVSRWYRPSDGFQTEQIAAAVIRLI